MMMRSNRSHCVRRASSTSSNFKVKREKDGCPLRETNALPTSKVKQTFRITVLELEPEPELEPINPFVSMIEKLFDKREAEQAEALDGIIELLSKILDEDDKDDREKIQDIKDLKRRYIATTFYRCLQLCSLKKGSTREVEKALKVIGMISIVIDCEATVSEIHRELFNAAFPGSTSACCCLNEGGSNAAKMLECLGIVSFFATADAEETQEDMKFIWDLLISLKSGMKGKKDESALVSAIHCWCFLLSSMHGWRLNLNWRGAISSFMEILDDNDHGVLVHEAASEALALIFETDTLDKFWDGETDSQLSYSQLREKLRQMVSKKVTGLDYLNPKVVKYLETLDSPKTRRSLCEKKLTLRSWYEVMQLKYVKSFLGKEFDNLMAKEEKLQRLFEAYSSNELNEKERDELLEREETRDAGAISRKQRKRDSLILAGAKKGGGSSAPKGKTSLKTRKQVSYTIMKMNQVLGKLSNLT